MDSSSGRSDLRPLTVEEEAIKLNTDCVYFLASPLTCKKGSECEYRHSEAARLNPRDCRFWLNGNCLNPKCPFRHPPLDGMVVSPRTTSGKIVTAAVTRSLPVPVANSLSYNLCRNNAPCYYYLKGACLKGDKCSFVHGGPLSGGNPLAKQNAKVSAQTATQLETSEKDPGKIKERNNQQNFSSALKICNVSADVLVNGSPSLEKGGRALENAPGSRNGVAISQTTYDPARSSSSYSSSENLNVQPDHLLHGKEAGEIFEESSRVGYTELERSLNHQPESPNDHYQNAHAAEEVFRDSSPGFDVLVDHVVGDADFFHEKDGFRSGASQLRRNVNLGDEYDHYHSDYEASTRLDGFRYDGAEFQHYGDEQNSDDWDQHMISSASERIFNRPLVTERSSVARRLRSPDEMDTSDLRYQLRKQRKQNGYFSATSSVRYSEPYNKHGNKNTNERYRTHNSYKDQQHLRESTISSRLRGRITLPKPPSPEIPSDLQDGRDRGRQRVLSPVRQLGGHRKLGQRLGWKPIEEFFANPRYFGNQQKTTDSSDLLDFAGPRSLEELKVAKAVRNSQCQSTKSNHFTSSLEQNRVDSLKAARLRDSEVSVEFEGPKPLSVLLKRKRESGSVNDAISGVSEDRKAIVESEFGSFVFPPANLEVIKTVSNLELPRVGAVEQCLIPTEDDEQIKFEQQDAGAETEANDAIEDDEEPYYTGQKDGEYYYDTTEGGDYKTEDDMDHIDVGLDADEDEDDFAKKVGLSLF